MYFKNVVSVKDAQFVVVVNATIDGGKVIDEQADYPQLGYFFANFEDASYFVFEQFVSKLYQLYGKYGDICTMECDDDYKAETLDDLETVDGVYLYSIGILDAGISYNLELQKV